MEALELIVTEWVALREESIQSMKNRNSIMTYGLAAWGAVFFAGITAFLNITHDSQWLSFLILALACPTLSLILSMCWLGEAMRMSRLGVYLKEREELVNDIVNFQPPEIKHSHDNKVMFWENYIREPIEGGVSGTRQMLASYLAVVGLFFLTMITPIAVAIGFPLSKVYHDCWIVPTTIVGWSFIVFLWGVYGLRARRKGFLD